MKLNLVWILIIGVIVTFLPVIIITSNSWYPLGEDESLIGGAIGGITAPFVGLTGAILIFYTFREQQKAISKQDDFRQAEFYKSFFNDVQSRYAMLTSPPFLTGRERLVSILHTDEEAFTIFIGVISQYYKLANDVLKAEIEHSHKVLLLRAMFSWYISFLQYTTTQVRESRTQEIVFVNPFLSTAFDGAYLQKGITNTNIEQFLRDNHALE